MPTPPKMRIAIAPPPSGFNGGIAEIFQLLANNIQITVPDGFLIGTIGSTEPISDTGPWLKDGKEWWVWDSTQSRYVAINADVPVGSIDWFAGYDAIDEDKYVICAGGAIPRAAPYDTLFAKIGVRFGEGDGTTTFNVPDLRGRTMICSGTGDGLTPRSLSDKLGEETHVLTGEELAGLHGADYASGQTNPIVALVSAKNNANDNEPDSASTAHENMQPSLVLIAAIRFA